MAFKMKAGVGKQTQMSLRLRGMIVNDKTQGGGKCQERMGGQFNERGKTSANFGVKAKGTNLMGDIKRGKKK